MRQVVRVAGGKEAVGIRVGFDVGTIHLMLTSIMTLSSLMSLWKRRLAWR